MRSQVSRRGSRDINVREAGYYRRVRIVTIRIVCIVFFSRYNPDLVWALGFIFGSRGSLGFWTRWWGCKSRLRLLRLLRLHLHCP